MDRVAHLRHQRGDLPATERRPLGHGLRILRLENVDTGQFLELVHAAVAVAIVRRRIRAVGEVQAVLVPQTAGQDGVGIADVVQLDIVHVGNGGDFRDHRHDEVLDFGVRRIQGLIVLHIGRELVRGLAEAVHAVPVVRLAALQHAGLPGVVLETFLVGDGGNGRDVGEVRLDTNARETMGLVVLELGPYLFQVRVLADAVPSVQGDGGLLFGAGAKDGDGRQQAEQGVFHIVMRFVQK